MKRHLRVPSPLTQAPFSHTLPTTEAIMLQAFVVLAKIVPGPRNTKVLRLWIFTLIVAGSFFVGALCMAHGDDRALAPLPCIIGMLLTYWMGFVSGVIKTMKSFD